MNVSALHSVIALVVRRALFPQLLAPAVAATTTEPSFSFALPLSLSAALRAPRPSAKGRRSSIARCRSLRQEIAAFEAEHTQQRGHVPKGSERFPLQHVYDEYRSLKVAIRDDAATHIEAVWRGYLCRRRARSTPRSGAEQPRGGGGPRARPAGAGGAPEAVGQIVSLRDEKASLKRLLRAFDVSFAASHGRAPSKSEKEHLRPQYTRYHELKAAIGDLEKPSTAAEHASARGGAGEAGSATRGAAAASARHSASSLAHTPDAAVSSGSLDDDTRSRRSDSLSSMAGIDGPEFEDEGEGGPGGTARASVSGGGGAAANALRAEKKRLQSVLRDYEKTFSDRWGRPVKSVKGERRPSPCALPPFSRAAPPRCPLSPPADIAPVLDKYQRYKELKGLLAEQSLAGAGARAESHQ